MLILVLLSVAALLPPPPPQHVLAKNGDKGNPWKVRVLSPRDTQRYLVAWSKQELNKYERSEYDDSVDDGSNMGKQLPPSSKLLTWTAVTRSQFCALGVHPRENVEDVCAIGVCTMQDSRLTLVRLMYDQNDQLASTPVLKAMVAKDGHEEAGAYLLTTLLQPENTLVGGKNAGVLVDWKLMANVAPRWYLAAILLYSNDDFKP